MCAVLGALLLPALSSFLTSIKTTFCRDSYVQPGSLCIPSARKGRAQPWVKAPFPSKQHVNQATHAHTKRQPHCSPSPAWSSHRRFPGHRGSPGCSRAAHPRVPPRPAGGSTAPRDAAELSRTPLPAAATAGLRCCTAVAAAARSDGAGRAAGPAARSPAEAALAAPRGLIQGGQRGERTGVEGGSAAASGLNQA